MWPNIAFPRLPLGIHLADGQPVLGDANTAVLFSVGRPYRRISIAGRGSWTEWIEVRPDVLEEMDREHLPRGHPGHAAPFQSGCAPAPSRAYLAHRSARARLSRSDAADPLTLEESALEVVAGVLAAGFGVSRVTRRTATDTARARRRVVFEVQGLLNRTLGLPLSLADLSAALELSPFHLCRVFREATGVPIHRYRDALRLRTSIERVEARDSTILEIAIDLGYSNEAHFSDAFLKAFGVRPRAMRGGRRRRR